MSLDRVAPVLACNTKVSGVVKSATTDSPRPQLAVMTNSLMFPDNGFAVNMTPAASAWTKSCTTTQHEPAPPAKLRYAETRSAKTDAQQCRTAVTTSCGVDIPNRVSICPANEAAAPSSAVAEERTATSGWGRVVGVVGVVAVVVEPRVS